MGREKIILSPISYGSRTIVILTLFPEDTNYSNPKILLRDC